MPVKKGFDAACDCRPILPQAKAAGVDFICRYYSRNPRKSLSPFEVAAFDAAGIDLVTVWEAAGNNPAAFSATAGDADAQAALQQAQTCGQPPGSGIYFAVDFDAGPIEAPAITAYFGAIKQRCAGNYRIGVYGSGYVCLTMARAALADLFWLAGAAGWRGTADCTGWHIRQHAPPEDPWGFGFLIDRDDAIDRDFGQWRPSLPAPAPTPAPEPPRLLRLRDVMMRGPDVTALQRLLDQHAAPCDVDGVFGRETDAALRTFQRRAGLAVDGICGPLTWAALRAAR